MASNSPPLPWLEPGDPFPSPTKAWGPDSQAPGLLAAGGQLSVQTLCAAYSQGIFPWFSDGQPILWWSPDPRMALNASSFRLHRSLRKTLQAFRNSSSCEIRFDTAFQDVIVACAQSPRIANKEVPGFASHGQAYIRPPSGGHAHSVETWIDDRLVGGLYCVAIGKAVFGESMFTRVPTVQKLRWLRWSPFAANHGIESIDCQQNTAHLATMGASEEPRSAFC
jgi:leucyl/phenylalanyl-tRNA--protein transferase